MVSEGLTDTAALLDLGYTSVVGRPSSTGGVKLLVELVQRRQPDEVVIVADGDEPGRRGADNLASVLLVYCPMVRVLVPKHFKDVRDFLRAGGTRQQLEQAIETAPARRLAVRSRRGRMASDNSLTLDYQPVGNNGKVRLTARLNGEAILTDKLDLATEKERGAFVRKLCKARKGIDNKAVAAQLEKIVGDIVAKPKAEGNDETDESRGRRSHADLLVEMAVGGGAELFHTPGGLDSEGYATVPVGNHKETWPVASKGFRRWLARLFWEAHAKAVGSQALQDAVNVLAGMAIHDGAEIPVAVRVAEQGGAIYLDLADSDWRAVEVTAAGCGIVDNPPVRFCRRRGMLALPAPIPGGKVDDLRGLVNIPDDDAWRLLVGWLIAALRPGRPFPVLVVNGEQGSAKSTLCRMARALIDPNEAALRRPPPTTAT